MEWIKRNAFLVVTLLFAWGAWQRYQAPGPLLAQTENVVPTLAAADLPLRSPMEAVQISCDPMCPHAEAAQGQPPGGAVPVVLEAILLEPGGVRAVLSGQAVEAGARLTAIDEREPPVVESISDKGLRIRYRGRSYRLDLDHQPSVWLPASYRRRDDGATARPAVARRPR